MKSILASLRPRAALVLAAVSLGLGHSAPAEETSSIDKLVRVPDLSPSLSAAEVAKPFENYQGMMGRLSKTWDAEVKAALTASHEALVPKVPEVSSLVLYSLQPSAARAGDQRPQFHDFPILGQVVLSDPGEANRWVSFLRDQIVTGSHFACGFEPRHGIRFIKADGSEIDMLMCYKCSQLALFGVKKVESLHNPVFSFATEDLLNALFDKQKIERDIPKAPQK